MENNIDACEMMGYCHSALQQKDEMLQAYEEAFSMMHREQSFAVISENTSLMKNAGRKRCSGMKQHCIVRAMTKVEPLSALTAMVISGNSALCLLLAAA